MTFLSRTFVLVAAGAVAFAGATTWRLADARSIARFSGAASSADELIDRWLDAIARNDEAALHRLRVTKAEYQEILIPGTVAPGEPPRRLSEQPREFFWQLLDTKSRDWGAEMMRRYGGKTFTPRNLRFSEPARQYAGYRALGLVRLDATTGEGTPVELEGPWIAEVDGRFKFIGLDWTD